MKPLFTFETPNKGKSSHELLSDRVNNKLIPILEEAKFGCAFQTFHILKDICSTALLQISYHSKSILVMPWVRECLSGRKLSYALLDYPRLNVPPKLRKLQNVEKIDAMFDLFGIYHIYFLIMVQKEPDNLFWFEPYGNIPKEYWKLTYRRKEEGYNRIHFPDYHSSLLKFDQLVKTLKRAIQYENK